MSEPGQFRLLVAGSWISQLGNGVTALTVLLALNHWNERPGWLIAAYAVAGVLPYALLGAAAGAMADRFDRRRLIVAADLARAGLVALMATAGPGRAWVLVALAFAVASVGTVAGPAAGALVPAVVGVDGVARAQATMMAGANVCRVLGLGVAATLFAGGSPRLGFGVDAATYLAAAGLRSRLRARPGRGGATTPEPFMSLLRDGARHLRSSREFAAVLVVSATSALAGAVLHVWWVPFAVGTLRAAPGWLPLLEGAGACGLVGAGLVVRRRPPPTANSMAVGLAVCGVALACFATVTHVGALVPLEVIIGAGQMVTITSSQAVLARTVPDAMLGRAFGALGSATEACSVACLIVAGLAADVVPARAVFGTTGAALVVGSLTGARLARRPVLQAPETSRASPGSSPVAAA